MYSIDYINYRSTTKYQPEIPDYVNNNDVSGTSQLPRSTRYQISRRKKSGKKKKRKMKQKQTYMLREQAESSGDKVSVCWWYGQSYDVPIWLITEGRRERPDGGQANMKAETKLKKTREDRNEGVSFRWICICLVFWGDPASHRIAIWIVVSYHAISQDTIYRYINCIHIPNCWDWYRDIVSRRYISRKRTQFLPSYVHQVWCARIVKKMFIWR